MEKQDKTREKNSKKQTCIKLNLSDYYQMHENAIKVCKAMDETRKYYWKAGEVKHGLEELVFYEGDPHLYLMSKDDIFNAVCKVAYNERKNGLPPRYFINYIYNMCADETPFKPLEQIVRIPMFSSDGRLMIEPGYYAEDMVLYIPYEGIDVRISPNPTEEEIKEAKSVLENDVLADFRFISPADKTHALAYLLLFFVRKMINGPTPLHIFEANDQRAASFLMRKLTPDRCVVLDNPTDSEFRKNVRQKLVCQPEEKVSAFCLENISKLKLPALEYMLSVQKYCDRIPGKNKTVDAEIKWILAIAGEKIVIDTHTTLKRVKIEFYSKKDFEFYYDKEKTVEDMNKIIQSGLTLAQTWVAAGCPKMYKTVSSRFIEWSEVMGSLLAFHGYSDFLSNNEYR